MTEEQFSQSLAQTARTKRQADWTIGALLAFCLGLLVALALK